MIRAVPDLALLSTSRLPLAPHRLADGEFRGRYEDSRRLQVWRSGAGLQVRVAASGLFRGLVGHPLFGKGADVNAQGGAFSTALQAAAALGYKEVVEILLGKGADVNAQGGHYGTALQAASAQGHKEVVEILLGKGADVNTQGGRYGTALQAASAGGHKEVVEMLLGKDNMPLSPPRPVERTPSLDDGPLPTDHARRATTTSYYGDL
ncbi:hypothetical protein NKR23_g8942 [Pleurostoma richardsiae]|uniref:Ankyrin n=1 Tax=Pleurostoma richardsiae TaxID=41990 RepID=A0AA38VKP1_9PEZI|nr:hypothetical protein NKR23_g8942 [Pleurostoma richardsiae]